LVENGISVKSTIFFFDFLKKSLISIKIDKLFQELLLKLKIGEASLLTDEVRYNFVEPVRTSILKDRQLIVIDFS